MLEKRAGLRVALLAGSLDHGGSEKQFVYMTRALRQAGVQVRTYSLERAGWLADQLRNLDLTPTWVGRHAAPPWRALSFAAVLRGLRPHIVQSLHSFANFYVAAAAPLYKGISIGGVRNDVLHELEVNGVWAKWLLRLPTALIANSHAAKRRAQTLGIRSTGVHVIPNVIDLSECGTPREHHPAGDDGIVVAAVANLHPRKRLDRFLAALALARRQVPHLRGTVAGDGPERARLEQLARELQLLPDGIRFLGSCAATGVLGQADILLHTSQHEGFPNAVLEAMSAGLPVVTTPAGDAGLVVENGVSGYVVAFDDINAMADHLVRLAHSPALRCALGAAGRERVEHEYRFEGLADALLDTYWQIADQRRDRRVLAALTATSGAR